MIFRSNERSEGSEIITEMNSIFAKNDFGMKSAIGELSLSKGSSTDTRNSVLFPDAVIFSDTNRLEPLMGWEFKMPEIPIDDFELVSNAKDKADRMNTGVFVLWNFQYSSVYIRKDDHTWGTAPDKTFTQCASTIKSRDDVFPNSVLWKSLLLDVLIYLNDELIADKFRSAPIEFNIGSYVQTISNKLTPLISNNYQQSTDTTLKPFMKKWFLEEKSELTKTSDRPSDAEIVTGFSKYVIIKWINRILFSHLIKQRHTSVKNILVQFSEDFNLLKLAENFNEIVNTTDFYTIFHVGRHESNLPDSVINNLNEFNLYLAQSDFSQSNDGFISKMLESIVDLSKRELMGLYTTPPNLAKLLTRLTIKNVDGDFADVTTGSGTIAREIIEYISEFRSLDYAHNHTWISDRYSYPLQIANLNITSYDSLNLKNIVFQKNALSMSEGEIIEITNPSNGEKELLPLPKFDYIISNLPFLSSNSRDIEDRLLLAPIAEKFTNLSDRSDLYQILIMKFEELLTDSPHARIGVITSNSWMKVQRDRRSFFKTLIEVYDVEYVISTNQGRWFKNADVVTSILVLKKKTTAPAKINFIALKKNPRLLSEDELNTLIDELKIDSPSEDYEVYRYTNDEVINAINLGMSLDSLFDNIDWMSHLKSKMIMMNDIFNNSRGVRTGGDAIFILPKTESHKIDSEYIYPMLRNSQQVQKYSFKESDVEHVYFYTSDTLEQIEEKGFTKTLDYLESISSSERALIRKNNPTITNWFNADQRPQYADFVTSINPEKRFFWAKMPKNLTVNQRVVAFVVKSPYREHLDLIHALLNSIPSLYMLISSGFGRALGVTDLTKDGIAHTSFMDPTILSQRSKDTILSAWNNVKNKDIQNLLEQLNTEEWINFNKTVLKAYGLEEELYYYISNSIKKTLTRRISAKNLNI